MGLGKKLSVAVAASFMSLSISLPGVQAAEGHQLKENQTNFLSKNAIAQSELSAPNDKAVKQFLKKNSNNFKGDPSKRLKLVESTTDALGYKHFRYAPVVNGVPIKDSQVIVHVDKSDNVYAVNGELHNQSAAKTDNSQKVSSEKALALAFKAIGKSPDAVSNGAAKNSNKAELKAIETKDGSYRLAYDVTIRYVEPEPANWEVLVDAETGSILKQQNKVEHAAATGSGTTLKGATVPLNISYEGGKYVLRDLSKPTGTQIITYDLQNRQSRLPGTLVSSTTKTFTSSSQRAAVDAHYNLGKVYDYFYSNFKRNSYDNRGSKIVSSVHYGTQYNNAAWTGDQMIYGDGDGSFFSPLSGSLDVTAHEMTHGVTQETANLIYENQPGALNESFSDVFGYFNDTEDWDIGEDITVSQPALRSLSNPTKYNQPDNYANYRNLPNTDEGDYGGVHTNSGIPNKAAYNTITKLGVSKSQQIYYRALTTYLTPSSTFKDAKAALIQSARDLYGSTDAAKVEAAWNAVGL
ncbi:neutral metalloprotease NprE [Bacillus subtilis]|uniref:neutral metalloprotease NprE n=1 Tax=Bacillus subtilis TaxID=1423 RepID=UPI003EC15463